MSSKRGRHCLLLRVRRCGATTESLVPELSHTSQNVRMRGFVPPPFFCTLPHGQRGSLARVQRKIWTAADFQNFLARPNTRRPRKKKEVRKRRASIYRTSPSDAVDYFLVSHVTGWAILGYPALEFDTGIFPFVFFFGHSLAVKFKFEFEKKKCHTGKASLVQGVQILVWFSFGNSRA